VYNCATSTLVNHKYLIIVHNVVVRLKGREGGEKPEGRERERVRDREGGERE
jgi:hypothetical protein